MSKQKPKPLKRAASLSSALLKTGGASRDASAPKPLAKQPDLAEDRRPAAKPPPQDLSKPPASPPTRQKPSMPSLEPEAFDGLLPGLLKSEPEAAPAKPRPTEAPPRPKLLDQFDFLQSRNQELALKEAAKASSFAASFLRHLRAGHFAEAEIDFARIMTLEPQVARKVLYNAELEDLAIICRAIGFKPLEFATIVALLRGSKGTRGLSAPDQLKASLGIFESIDRDCALGLLEHIPWLPQRDWQALKSA